jgi:hypothetical protein
MNIDKCKTGMVCQKCKFWKLIERLPGMKGRCDKRDYLISCYHSCCKDFEKE